MTQWMRLLALVAAWAMTVTQMAPAAWAVTRVEEFDLREAATKAEAEVRDQLSSDQAWMYFIEPGSAGQPLTPEKLADLRRSMVSRGKHEIAGAFNPREQRALGIGSYPGGPAGHILGFGQWSPRGVATLDTLLKDILPGLEQFKVGKNKVVFTVKKDGKSQRVEDEGILTARLAGFVTTWAKLRE